ncbi:MAG: radical SAM protein [Candidatus Omnitrophica bacterium]|nr:radical SAM protein [Candidatus Omnitrophota bacterium]
MIDARNYYLKTLKKQIAFFKKGVKPIAPYFLNLLEIELSSNCNLSCPFCPSSELRRKRGFLPFEHYKRLIDYLSSKEYFPRISFSGDGEMFLHKNIVDFVSYAKQKGFHVQIINNGTLCGPKASSELISAGLDRIQFSVDSIVKKTYDKMRRQKRIGADLHYYEKTIFNILEYAKMNYESNSPTTISIMAVQTDLNRNEADSFRRYWEKFPIHNVYLSVLYTLAGNVASRFKEAKNAEYDGKIEDKPVCVNPFILACIKTDGKMLLCTHDSHAVYPIGNIIENGEKFDLAENGERIERTIQIDKLWNNDRAQELRRALIEGKPEKFVKIGHDCQHCNAPLTGGSIDEYCMGSASARVKKILLSMNKRRIPFNPKCREYVNVEKEIVKIASRQAVSKS